MRMDAMDGAVKGISLVAPDPRFGSEEERILYEKVARRKALVPAGCRKGRRGDEEGVIFEVPGLELIREPSVLLDRTDDLFNFDLDGNAIPDHPEVSPACPLCNNESWAEIDRMLLKGASDAEVAKAFGDTFTKIDVLNHKIRHLLPIGVSAIKSAYPDLFNIQVDESVLTKKERMELYGISEQFKDIESFTGEDDSVDKEKGFRARKRGRLANRKEGVYAVQETGDLPIQIWSPKRMENEKTKRAENTITFVSELMNVRKMSYHVYREVMREGNPKYYGTAIAAAREIRGVVETLGKFSLIAKQLGDNSAGMKSLSPQMQDMMSKLGMTIALPDGRSSDFDTDTELQDEEDLSFIDDDDDDPSDIGSLRSANDRADTMDGFDDGFSGSDQ